MARYLKRGMDASAIRAADVKVRVTVEQILEQLETGGDAAVRELSQQFDNWSPLSFKLAASEVDLTESIRNRVATFFRAGINEERSRDKVSTPGDCRL